MSSITTRNLTLFISQANGCAGTQAIGWKYLLVYTCWIFVEAILIWFLWPETSGRSLEELAFRKFLSCHAWMRCVGFANQLGDAVFEDKEEYAKTVSKSVMHVEDLDREKV